MKKIGFIDFFLDEWHANHLPEWIRSLGRNIDVAYAWADSTAPTGMDTAAWCQKYQVEAVSSMEELIEKSDYLLVLSPDHPEHHEKLSRLPLMSGKPTYIDKTFSPDLASGKRLFELAEKYHTPMFSSSALRFGKELAAFPNEKINRSTLEYVGTLGTGVWANYSVHQLEMIVSLMGPGAKRMKSFSTSRSNLVSIDYGDGRRASMLQMPKTPFQVALQTKDGDGLFIPECSDIFERLTDAMLDFFESGKAPVCKEETLEIMALIEAGRQAQANPDTWVPVPQA